MPSPRRRSKQGVSDTLREHHPAVLLRACEDVRSITLEKLIVPAGVRGQGIGSAVMRDLIAYADRFGKQIQLTPSGAFGSSPRRLVVFYARFGFVRNIGAQHDPACRESMYRNPVTRHRALPRAVIARTARVATGPRIRRSVIGGTAPRYFGFETGSIELIDRNGQDEDWSSLVVVAAALAWIVLYVIVGIPLWVAFVVGSALRSGGELPERDPHRALRALRVEHGRLRFAGLRRARLGVRDARRRIEQDPRVIDLPQAPSAPKA